MEGISWKPTDAIEILIGVYLYFGAMDQSMFPTELIWDKKSGDKMACSTFTSTGKNLTCDNFFADKELCKQMSTNKMTEKKQNIHTDRVSGRQSEH
ncbi:hypothetical protein RRG08_054546 [Elysia crispata]|uniref:PiggyBac transposable element-derived protein domain-containing protein n=1 Tax=Elysia crispata TaxID=231223 RepID=A0AAE1B1H8_9GAST|nr:hypothetical protein RRG08_054546 [Elysia crispata]